MSSCGFNSKFSAMGALLPQGYAVTDHVPNKCHLGIGIPHQVQCHESDAPAPAVHHYTSCPEPVVVTGCLAIIAETGHKNWVSVVYGFGLAKLRLVLICQQRTDRGDIPLAHTHLQRTGRFRFGLCGRNPTQDK
jgi:hypothetical protein